MFSTWVMMMRLASTAREESRTASCICTESLSMSMKVFTSAAARGSAARKKPISASWKIEVGRVSRMA